MPCSKYKGAQRRACYLTKEWRYPERLTRLKKRKRKFKRGLAAASRATRRKVARMGGRARRR